MAKISLQDALSMVDEEAPKFGVDPEVGKSILLAENYGNDIGKVLTDIPRQTVDTEKSSPRGAKGLMQVMPGTYDSLKSLGFLPSGHTMDDARGQIQAGLASLKEIMKRTGSNDISAIAADYNAGPRGSKAFLTGGKLPSETDNYLNKVNLAATSLSANDPNSRTFTASQSDVRNVDNKIAGQGGVTISSKTTKTVPDFEAVQKMLQDNAIQVSGLIHSITEDRTAEGAAYHEMASAMTADALAQTEAGAAQAAVESAIANTKKRVTGILGIDTTDADNTISKNMAEYTSLEEQKKALANEIDSRSAVGIFDNPMQWLVNQTILPGKVNTYNAIIRRRNDLIHQNEALQHLAANQEAVDVAASADDITKYYTSIGNAKAAQANAQAAAAKAQAASASARAATTVAGLVDTQTRLGMEMARMRQIIESNRTGNKSPEEIQAEQDFETGLKRVGTMIGSPDISIAGLKRMTKSDQDEWAKRVAKNNIGDDLYEALNFMDKFGNTQRMTETGSAELARYITNMKQEVITRARRIAAEQTMDMSGKALTREQLLQAAANELDKEMFVARQNMAIARPGNIFLADHKSMATRFDGDPNNPIYKVARQAAANNIKLSDQQLFSTLTNLVDNGKLKPKDAAQALSEYYSKAIESNNKNRSPQLLGFDKQTDYMFLPKESPKTLDLTNPTQVENFLVSRVTAQMYQGLGGGGFVFVPQGAVK